MKTTIVILEVTVDEEAGNPADWNWNKLLKIHHSPEESVYVMPNPAIVVSAVGVRYNDGSIDTLDRVEKCNLAELPSVIERIKNSVSGVVAVTDVSVALE